MSECEGRGPKPHACKRYTNTVHPRDHENDLYNTTLVYLIVILSVTVERCVASHDVVGRNTSLPGGQSVVLTGMGLSTYIRLAVRFDSSP